MITTGRRNFIMGTAAMAAGSVLGGLAFRGIKKHGPVNFWVRFLSPKPTSFEVFLHSDEQRDLFRIHADGHFDFSLARVKELLKKHSQGRCYAITYDRQSAQKIPLTLCAQSENLVVFYEHNPNLSEPTPSWMRRSDIERVL